MTNTKLGGSAAACGAVGGVISLVLPSIAGGAGPTPFAWWHFPVALLVGATAAVIGLFAITNTDRNDLLRLFALATLFGLCWKPVLQAAQNSIEIKNTKEAYQQLFDAPVIASSSTTAPSAAGETANASTERLRVMTRSLSLISDPAIRAKGAQRIASLSSELVDKGASTDSLLEVGTAADAFPEGQVIRKDLAAKLQGTNRVISPDAIKAISQWKKEDNNGA